MQDPRIQRRKDSGWRKINAEDMHKRIENC